VSEFDRATAVRRRDDRTYDVDLDLGWSIAGKPNGGYLLAILARAACETAGKAHPLAVSGHFLRPPDGGASEVRVELVKAGRTVSTVRATLWQGSRPCLDTLVTAGELDDSDVVYTDNKPPDLPPPDECGRREDAPFPVALLDHVDVRIDPPTAPFPNPTGVPVIQGWMRLREDATIDPFSLQLMVDAMPPTVFHLSASGWAPTVELTCLVRGLPAPGWVAFRAHASHVAAGWFDETVDVWDATGRLVAQSRQLALVGRA
jgi:acyl-CoA thioesterase